MQQARTYDADGQVKSESAYVASAKAPVRTSDIGCPAARPGREDRQPPGVAGRPVLRVVRGTAQRGGHAVAGTRRRPDRRLHRASRPSCVRPLASAPGQRAKPRASSGSFAGVNFRRKLVAVPGGPGIGHGRRTKADACRASRRADGPTAGIRPDLGAKDLVPESLLGHQVLTARWLPGTSRRGRLGRGRGP